MYTPNLKHDEVPQPSMTTPTQGSPPPKTTPKSNVKALPTARDHTSDQLNPEGDEYIPREFDPDGEKKVDTMGNLQGGREYKMRTFQLEVRGPKLFMLATECARVLTYRDSYLLFNKNRSLFKIIASQTEKEDLIKQDILPYSYRSRQIAIVTARSMFRQFGSRVIKDGRRVRDDYWEAKARKQGFTEADAAGEKRPGAGRQREATGQTQIGARQIYAPGSVVYSNGPGFENMQPPAMHPGIAATMAPLPMIASHDNRYRDISRPRQDMAVPPYSDLTRSTTDAEIMSQAAHAAEYSKSLNQQRSMRKGIMEDWWAKPHEPPVSTPQSQAAEPVSTHQYDSSPRFATENQVSPQNPYQTQSMNQSSYQPHLQSPARQSSLQTPYNRNPQFSSNQPQLPPQPHVSRTASNLSISHTPSQYPGQNFSPHSMNPPQHPQQQPMWGQPPPQPQQSPGLHRMTTPSYSPSLGHGGSPVHTQSQSPHQQQPQTGMPGMMNQMYGGGAGGSMPGYNMAAMNMATPRGMYGSGGPGQYIPGQQQQQQNPGQSWQGGVTQAGGGGGYQGFQ